MIAKLGELAMDEGGAGDVDAARRLSGDEEFWPARQFPRNGDALLIAAGKCGDGIGEAAIAHGEIVERPLGGVADLAQVQEAVTGEGRVAFAAGEKILADGRALAEALLGAI